MTTSASWSLLVSGASELGVPLDETALHLFQEYTRLLLATNQHTNLTAARDLGTIIVKLYLDSISLVPAIASSMAIDTRDLCQQPLSAVDIGAGAGIPGLPIRFLWPALQLHMVESVKKKASFLTQVILKLDIASSKVIPDRAELLAQNNLFREQYDLVLARAVASLPTLVELTLPFARLGGLVALPKGANVNEELEKMDETISLLGGSLLTVEELFVPGLDKIRTLVLIRKVKETPARYPRRPGIPRKRPLGKRAQSKDNLSHF